MSNGTTSSACGIRIGKGDVVVVTGAPEGVTERGKVITALSVKSGAPSAPEPYTRPDCRLVVGEHLEDRGMAERLGDHRQRPGVLAAFDARRVDTPDVDLAAALRHDMRLREGTREPIAVDNQPESGLAGSEPQLERAARSGDGEAVPSAVHRDSCAAARVGISTSAIRNDEGSTTQSLTVKGGAASIAGTFGRSSIDRPTWMDNRASIAQCREGGAAGCPGPGVATGWLFDPPARGYRRRQFLQATPMNIRAARILALMTACALGAPAGAAEWITFDAPSEGPGAASPGPTANPVRAYLALPIVPGPFPGVVLLPACDGRQPYQQSWAGALAARGIAALLVDHYFMHDLGSTCEPVNHVVDVPMRVRHARVAAGYLAGVPGVDGTRIAVMGWGDAPLERLIGIEYPAGDTSHRIGAVVAIAPSRCPREKPDPPTPWLALLAAAQPVAEQGDCATPPDGVDVIVYPGTSPGFDDPRAGERSRPGPPRRYDRVAHARAIDDVGAFLERHFGAAGTAARDYARSEAGTPEERGTWAIDPTDPGADLPPRGASLFDRVFSRVVDGVPVHHLPFPFEALLDRLAAVAGADRSARPPLDFALLPLGRSLQREAAAPDYFDSPRIVVAVTGEPEVEPVPPFALSARLFLGYQPRSDVIEAISYNAEANRFEFQIVRGYRAGATPEVRYARRALCTSCHQNAAPIFAEANWRESNANARIVARLRTLGPRFHGVPVAEDDRGVAAVDSATDEANLLPVLQRLWNEGCDAGHPARTAACRAGAVQSMLQYGLSGGAGFDRAARLHAEAYLPVQRASWAARWPDGLLVPRSSIPDREPLMLPVPSVVPVAQDPLRRRPPGQRWTFDAPRDPERMIRGLARTLPAPLFTRLDAHLQGADGGAIRTELASACTVLRRGQSTGTLQIECMPHREAAASFGLRATLREHEGRVEGTADWLELPNGSYSQLPALGTLVTDPTGGHLSVRLKRRDGSGALRAPDGNTIVSITLRWSGADAGAGRRWEASGTLGLADDFAPVRVLLADAARTSAPGAALLEEWFDGRAIAAWLLASLDAAPGTVFSPAPPGPVPEPIAESSAMPGGTLAALAHRGPLRTFERFCAACHGGDTRSPPGFLHGDATTVRERVAHCAARIYYRLSMWHRPVEQRGAPPMPPLQGLHLAGTDTEDWRRGESLAALLDYVEGLLEAGDTPPSAVLAAAYHDLDECLPPASVAAAQ